MLKVVLTGHSYGLGAAIAAKLLAHGARIMAISRSTGESTGMQQISLDLSDLKAVAQWLAGPQLAAFLNDAEQAILINNAGRVEPIGPPGMQGANNIAQAVSLNVAAPLMLADAFAGVTKHVHDRRILHISSGAARSPYAGWSVYCATKAALDQHAAAVEQDQLDHLRIESLAPGVIDTAMQAQIRATTVERFPAKARFEGLKKDGALASAQSSADAVVNHLLSARFGQQTATDIRQL